MKNFFPAIAALGFLLLSTLPQSCWYDNEEELYGTPGGCDTIDVRYSVEIQAILQNNCYSCHSVSSNVSGFPFDDYNTLKNYAASGLLTDRINNINAPMPPTGLMPDCDRQKIEAWVKAGALDN